MEITLTALGVLLAFLIGGWLLRLLVRLLGTGLLPQRVDALNVMGAIAFWGMAVVGLTLTVRLLAAPAVQDALTTAATHSPALIAAVAVLVLGGGYVGLCLWASGHVPATVTVGGIHVGGMSPDQADTAIERGSRSLLTTPIALTVPGRDDPVQVVPSEAGFHVDAEQKRV